MASLSPSPRQYFVDNNGNPLVGGKLWTFISNTTTPQATFTDSSGSTENTNPIILNSRGEASIWLNDELNYTYYLTDPNDVEIWTENGINSFGLSGSSGSASVGFIQLGTGAIARNLQSRGRDTIWANDFSGVDATGATDSTAGIQAAVVRAEAIDAVLNFAPGTYDMKMIFIETGNIEINAQGCTFVQNFDPVNSVPVGGPGEWKISAAFFLKRGAENVVIRGAVFDTDDASFPAYATGFGGYFPSIGGNHANNVEVTECRFIGGQRRALFFQAGNDLNFHNNKCENNTILAHVGYTANELFYDNTTNTTGKFSPLRPKICYNLFDGHTTTDLTACLFLSGPTAYSVVGNRFINMNEATALRPILLYSNDFGPYSDSGVALDVITGEVSDNEISGTFLDGVELRGYSTNATATWDNSYAFDVLMENNRVSGTGNGFKLNKVRGARLCNGNTARVSGSPLRFERESYYMTVADNTFVCTGTSSTQTTVDGAWAANSRGLIFERNKIYTSANDQYAFRSVFNMLEASIDGNWVFFSTNVASCRPIVLTLGGISSVSNNWFDVNTTVASITLMVLNGNANAGNITIEKNKLYSVSGAGATTVRFLSAESFNSVTFLANITGGPITIEGTKITIITKNIMIMPSANAARAIFLDNSLYNSKANVQIHENDITQSVALNQNLIGITSYNDATNNTTSRLTMNNLSGNSTGSLVQQSTQGSIGYIGNVITNAGSGGTAIAVTGSATGTAL